MRCTVPAGVDHTEMPQRRTLLNSPYPLAVVLAAALALAGCGPADDDPAGGEADATSPAAAAPESAAEPPAEPAGGGAPDPCALLTEDEVAATVGAEVTGTEGPFDEFQASNCTWSYPGPTLGELTISVWVGGVYYSPDTIEQGWEELSGIGDVAHQATDGPLCTTIFRIGDLVVQVISSDGPDDACVDLARTAADRI